VHEICAYEIGVSSIILAGTSVILTEAYCGFPQSLQANAETVPLIMACLPSSTSF
jgi:hypothetical protein